MARHERGEVGDERAVASRAARGRGGGSGRAGWRGADASAGAEGSVFGDAEVAPTPAAQDPFAEAEAAPAVPSSEFSDAVAIQIPSQVPSDARKPYFLFGDGQHSVDLWFFDLALPGPLQFTGKGSADLAQNDAAGITGVASYDHGEWSVIFKRPLRPGSGAGFSPGEFMPIAFSVWDGLSRERGNRRGLSIWYSLYVEPADVPTAVGPMIRTALVILAIELAVIGLVRRRYGSRGRDEVGGKPGQQPATSV
jgi:hypothetical protein